MHESACFYCLWKVLLVLLVIMNSAKSVGISLLCQQFKWPHSETTAILQKSMPKSSQGKKSEPNFSWTGMQTEEPGWLHLLFRNGLNSAFLEKFKTTWKKTLSSKVLLILSTHLVLNMHLPICTYSRVNTAFNTSHILTFSLNISVWSSHSGRCRKYMSFNS